MNVPLFARMWREIKRKFFHLTALLYVVGIIYLPRRTYLCILAGALAAVFAVEIVRLQVPAVNEWFDRRFGGLFRDQERHRFSGVSWMLAGVLTTAAMVGPLPMAAASILYLVLGDAVASLIGIRVGGPHWPGSDKRISGSVACFAVCLLIGVAIIRTDYGWPGVLIGAAVATILERGFAPINDNFLIPVGSGLALLAAYRIPPFSGIF
jgi:dolichol kinase